MDRQIFLENLRRALYGKIDESDLAGHMRYYDEYISQEIQQGKSEQEVLNDLGDPRLIARAIIETSGAKTAYREYTVSEEGEADSQPEYRIRHLNGWQAKAAMAAVLAVVFLLLVLLFHILAALLPALIVISVIVWVIRRIRDQAP